MDTGTPVDTGPQGLPKYDISNVCMICGSPDDITLCQVNVDASSYGNPGPFPRNSNRQQGEREERVESVAVSTLFMSNDSK